MKENKIIPKIFLSYAQANSDIANLIENDLNAVNLIFTRDLRDLKYRNSIKEFMQRIGKSDYVLMIISDEYLRRSNCMYEVLELLNTHEFEKRIIPILLENAMNIFDNTKRVTYYDFWNEEIIKAQERYAKHQNNDHLEQLKHFKEIYNRLDDFFIKIKDLKTDDYISLKKQNYRPILDIFGIEDSNIIEEAISINNIEDREEKELALENFLSKYPNNQYGLFYKAYHDTDNNEFKKAKKHYEQLLEKYPNDASAHNNLALILKNNLLDFIAAKEHFNQAILINPKESETYYNLANLL